MVNITEICNLLHNTIVATKNNVSDKQIKISVYTTDSRIILDIIDNSPGVSLEILDKIFVPFYTTTENGAGIALSLSKTIVQSHQGYLTYHREKSWSVFRVNLPLK